MRKNKITMVNPEQITARGWKGFKTKRAVENFTTKYRVNHVYWRAPGNKKILLVDMNHFREIWQEYKTTIQSKPIQRKKPTSKKTYASPTRRRTFARKPISKKRTWSNRPKRRTRITPRTRTY